MAVAVARRGAPRLLRASVPASSAAAAAAAGRFLLSTACVRAPPGPTARRDAASRRPALLGPRRNAVSCGASASAPAGTRGARRAQTRLPSRGPRRLRQVGPASPAFLPSARPPAPELSKLCALGGGDPGCAGETPNARAWREGAARAGRGREPHLAATDPGSARQPRVTLSARSALRGRCRRPHCRPGLRRAPRAPGCVSG